MRRLLFILLCVLPLLIITSSPALAWGSATHALIAKAIAGDFISAPPLLRGYLQLQFAYGAIAPDLAWVAQPAITESLGHATHRAPGYDDVVQIGQPDRTALIAFSLGWLTHNEDPGEAWGADFWAHDESEGYVVEKASVLAASAGIPEGLAHDYVEAAIDLLIDHQRDASIGSYV